MSFSRWNVAVRQLPGDESVRYANLAEDRSQGVLLRLGVRAPVGRVGQQLGCPDASEVLDPVPHVSYLSGNGS